MTWCVVKFDDENTVEAVPDIWYMKNNSQCYWSPEDTPKHIVVDFIKKSNLLEPTGHSMKETF